MSCPLKCALKNNGDCLMEDKALRRCPVSHITREKYNELKGNNKKRIQS